MQPSDLCLLGDLQSNIHLDAKVAHCGFKFAMAEQQLHGPQILRPSIDECRLGSPHRVRAAVCRVENQFIDPVFEDSGVPGSQMGRVVTAARKDKVARADRLYSRQPGARVTVLTCAFSICRVAGQPHWRT